MEGPTPVSALIHAATMVTAGVFIILRCSPIIQQSGEVMTGIAIVGGVTAIYAATVGLVQNDIKKVIAYSTCSQLGYMVMASGIGAQTASIYHLNNHAYFKALLFLSAGSVIHAIGDEQDIRKMGSMKERQPYTYMMMVIGSLSLMGVPFLTGYYSKEGIIEMAYGTYTVEGTMGH
jgi:NADH-ubiquinone oxidoreductase chain 5